ncbi:hypothetical protein HDU93_005646, partial [Gonapodya sp. JEL0774]
LVDLQTETSYVRLKQAAYLSDLMSLGVSGFRIDAAKHMNPVDINTTIAMVTPRPYIVQEVNSDDLQAVKPSMYTSVGSVHEFRACYDLFSSFVNAGSLSGLLQWPKPGWVPSDHAVVFVANHDTERDSAGKTIKVDSPNNAYLLAHVFLLAQPYGSRVTVLSSYNFTTTDQGPPLDSASKTLDSDGCGSPWRCEHRWTVIAEMV